MEEKENTEEVVLSEEDEAADGVGVTEGATEGATEGKAITKETGTGSLKETLQSLKGRPFKEKVNILWHDKRVRFVFVGVLNTLVGYGVTIIMYLICGVDWTKTEETGWGIISVCELIGQIAGMINSFFFNKYFTFRQKKKSVGETIRFIIVGLVQYGVSTGGTYLLWDMLKLNKFVAKLLVAVASTLVSYFGHNLFTFGKYFYKNKKENKDESIK